MCYGEVLILLTVQELGHSFGRVSSSVAPVAIDYYPMDLSSQQGYWENQRPVREAG